MKPRLIPVLEQCIENGINLGWNRAHKHDDAPPAEHVRQFIQAEIWNELYERFQFEQPGEQPED